MRVNESVAGMLPAIGFNQVKGCLIEFRFHYISVKISKILRLFTHLWEHGGKHKD